MNLFESIQDYLFSQDMQILNAWKYSEFRKGNNIKGQKIADARKRMVKNRCDWIEKGIVGRFIYKYLGI